MLIEFKSIRIIFFNKKAFNAKKTMYFYGYIREQTSFCLNTITKAYKGIEENGCSLNYKEKNHLF